MYKLKNVSCYCEKCRKCKRKPGPKHGGGLGGKVPVPKKTSLALKIVHTLVRVVGISGAVAYVVYIARNHARDTLRKESLIAELSSQLDRQVKINKLVSMVSLISTPVLTGLAVGLGLHFGGTL